MGPAALRLGELAARLGLELEGDAALEVVGVASLEDAAPDQLTFLRSAAYAERLADSRARAVVAPPGLDVGARSVLRSDDPGRDFFRAARILVPEPEIPAGVHPTAVVGEGARIDPSAAVDAGCVVGRDVVVGARSVLHPGVVLYDGATVGRDCTIHARCVIAAASVLGDRVVLQPGVVIGGAGFGYVGREGGGLAKVHDVGRVRIEDDVEIGANSTVDRGTLGDTRIGRGTKIDNLVQIAHNCVIGEDCVIVAQAGIAGSTRMDRGGVLLSQSGVAGHLHLGAGAFVGPRTGVHKDVPAGGRVLGSPQRPERVFHRENAAVARLPELFRRVRALERARAGTSEE